MYSVLRQMGDTWRSTGAHEGSSGVHEGSTEAHVGDTGGSTGVHGGSTGTHVENTGVHGGVQRHMWGTMGYMGRSNGVHGWSTWAHGGSTGVHELLLLFASIGAFVQSRFLGSKKLNSLANRLDRLIPQVHSRQIVGVSCTVEQMWNVVRVDSTIRASWVDSWLQTILV